MRDFVFFIVEQFLYAMLGFCIAVLVYKVLVSLVALLPNVNLGMAIVALQAAIYLVFKIQLYKDSHTRH